MASLGSFGHVNLSKIGAIGKIDISKIGAVGSIQVVSSVPDEISIDYSYGYWDYLANNCNYWSYLTVTSSGSWTSNFLRNDGEDFAYYPISGSAGNTQVTVSIMAENWNYYERYCEIEFVCGIDSTYFSGTQYYNGMLCPF